MPDAKMSIAESSSDAHTLIEPVSQPVTVFSTMRKAAAVMESRAAELFSLSSDAAPCAAVASAPDVCINYLAPNSSKSMSDRVRVLGHLLQRAAAPPQRDYADAREDERRRDRVAEAELFVRSEEERRGGEGEERLKVDVDGDRAGRDTLQRPRVEVISADRLHQDGVDEHQPDDQSDVVHSGLREVVAAEG